MRQQVAVVRFLDEAIRGHGRLKQAGMRWQADGIEAIAHLRSALLNCRTGTILEAARIAA